MQTPLRGSAAVPGLRMMPLQIKVPARRIDTSM
jgi:hypothetical protein